MRIPKVHTLHSDCDVCVRPVLSQVLDPSQHLEHLALSRVGEAHFQWDLVRLRGHCTLIGCYGLARLLLFISHGLWRFWFYFLRLHDEIVYNTRSIFSRAGQNFVVVADVPTRSLDIHHAMDVFTIPKRAFRVV